MDSITNHDNEIAVLLGDSPPIRSPSIGVRAQGASTKTSQPNNSRRKQQTRRTLLNPRHEATIRNILLPKFSQKSSLQTGNHTSNVAVIVSSSRYWFNYRHVTNALSMYHLLKRGGFSDDNIVLMLADDIPCNMRNVYRGKIFSRGARGGQGEDLMSNVEIDYSGTDVTVDAFLRVLLGRPLEGGRESHGGHQRSFPKMDENTNVLVYLTGHGGDNFFKFQDGEELMSHDVASAFSQMYQSRRYNEILFISDTCQAFTMADEISVPNVFSVGSSLKGQNSYASHTDSEVGQSVIDRYSKVVRDFVDDAVSMTVDVTSTGAENGSLYPFDSATIAVMERLNMHDALVRVPTMHGDLGNDSKVGFTDRLCKRSMNKVPLSDFFAATADVREQRIRQTKESLASLWMNTASETVEFIISPKSAECTVESEPDIMTRQSQTESSHNDKTRHKSERSPYDIKFFIMAFVFLIFVKVSFNTW
ncbi:hypothetical protein HJC23_013945 [Cyclotella cryptica]|uniref:GPI-anchor transamidase n=1 Tax=Cyclotella cryptica TaxID=29204 RepID=A0ABD3Q2E0_9STRA|eukprot:CCRYP_009189-RA/>CCRYP_009189-RA protein AED:0.02 eAED:0.02 QI:0/-1/0/1/-1/1/1/0/475